MFTSLLLKWNVEIQYKSIIQSEHVILTTVGCGGGFPSGIQEKRVPHFLGWRVQWHTIDRALGRGARLPLGQGLWDSSCPSMALENTWNPVLQLPWPCPLSDTFHHFPHPSPYTFPDTACPLLPKSSHSSTFCLG